jgi:hypothetical protein
VSCHHRDVPATLPGRRIVAVSLAGTALFTLVAVVEAVVMGWTQPVGVFVALSLFFIGCLTCLVAYGVAVGRSRAEEIGVGGLYFLGGTVAPPKVRWLLDGALAVQVVVALVTAGVRPYTPLAFGVLVPMFGIGQNGLWAARHGHFGPRRLPAAAADDAGERPGMEQNAGHG